MKRSALKGRKLTWINPTHIALQNEFRSIFGGENDVHQNKGERLSYSAITLYAHVILHSILRPFRARRRGWSVPGVKTPGLQFGHLEKALSG
jgi:hypothetical protein